MAPEQLVFVRATAYRMRLPQASMAKPLVPLIEAVEPTDVPQSVIAAALVLLRLLPIWELTAERAAPLPTVTRPARVASLSRLR